MEKDTALEERGWKTKREIVMFVEYERYEYKGTKTEENQKQGFISGKQLRNLWCGNCLKAWKQRKDGGGCKVECVKCERNDTIRGRKTEKRKILCPELSECHDGDTMMRTVHTSRTHMDWSAHHQPFRNSLNYLNNCQLL